MDNKQVLLKEIQCKVEEFWSIEIEEWLDAIKVNPAFIKLSVSRQRVIMMQYITTLSCCMNAFVDYISATNSYLKKCAFELKEEISKEDKNKTTENKKPQSSILIKCISSSKPH